MELSLKRISALIVASLVVFTVLCSCGYMIMNNPVEPQTEDKPAVRVFTPKGNLEAPFKVLVYTNSNVDVTLYYNREVIGHGLTNATGAVLFTVTQPQVYERTGFSAAIG